LTLLFRDSAKIQIRVGKFWIQFEGSPVSGSRFVPHTLLRQDRTKAIVRLRNLGLQFEGSQVADSRFA
jgi:hypothetical protein